MPDEKLPPAPEVQGLNVFGYVYQQMGRGMSPADIEELLLSKGLNREEAAALVGRLVSYERKREAETVARELLGQGIPAQQVQTALIARGFDEQKVAVVIEAEKRNLQKERAEEIGPWRTILGLALFFGGAVLFIGNATGAFPSLPYAGAILMGLGTVILVIAGHEAEP
jgi:hypothetical protein